MIDSQVMSYFMIMVIVVVFQIEEKEMMKLCLSDLYVCMSSAFQISLSFTHICCDTTLWQRPDMHRVCIHGIRSDPYLEMDTRPSGEQGWTKNRIFPHVAWRISWKCNIYSCNICTCNVYSPSCPTDNTTGSHTPTWHETYSCWPIWGREWEWIWIYSFSFILFFHSDSDFLSYRNRFLNSTWSHIHPSKGREQIIISMYH